MLQKYRLKDVTSNETHETRTDKFYPALIGEIFYLDVNELKVDEVFYLYKDKPWTSYLRTSLVQNWADCGHMLVITTLNSNYYLEKVNED